MNHRKEDRPDLGVEGGETREDSFSLNNRSVSTRQTSALGSSQNDPAELDDERAKSEMSRRSKSPFTIALIMAGMVIAGSCTTIFLKIMDQTVMMPDGKGEDGEQLFVETEFKHPLLMNLLMFIGEASLLIVLQYQMKKDPIARVLHERHKANPLMFVAPAFLDTCGSFLNFTALAFITASSYQILKMLGMVFVVLLSIIVFQRSYKLIQYLAVLSVIGGLTVVTLTDLYGKSEESDKETQLVLMGIICMIAGQFFHAGQGIVEEYILQRAGSGQEPCYMMGWEGVFGIIITLMILVPAQFLACPFSEDQCVNGHIDDMTLAHAQMLQSPNIFFLAIGFVVTAAGFNGFGSFATKFTSVANRTVVEQSRVILIWTFFLAYTGVGHEEFDAQKVLGFAMIVVGVLFFNEILVIENCRVRYLPKSAKEGPESKPGVQMSAAGASSRRDFSELQDHENGEEEKQSDGSGDNLMENKDKQSFEDGQV